MMANSVPPPRTAPVCDTPADKGSQGTAAVRSTLAYIFPGQLEHKTPLVLLGVSGPGLVCEERLLYRLTFHNIGAPSFDTLAHKTPSARRYPWPPAAINSEGIASGQKHDRIWAWQEREKHLPIRAPCLAIHTCPSATW